jgi:hypothetical protein
MVGTLVTLSNAERVGVGVYNAFLELQKAVRDATGQGLWISSGFRSYEDQERIFRERYTTAPGNRHVYDRRWWNGQLWYRISPAGTVAQPGTSRHEQAGAVDFGGIPAGGGTALANWLRANAPNYGFSPTGYGFGEAWHYDYTGDPWAGEAPAGGNGTPFEPGEEEMTPEERELLKRAAADAAWVKARLGGSVKDGQSSITDQLRGIRNTASAILSGVTWLRTRVGGSAKTGQKSVTDRLREIRNAQNPDGFQEPATPVDPE